MIATVIRIILMLELGLASSAASLQLFLVFATMLADTTALADGAQDHPRPRAAQVLLMLLCLVCLSQNKEIER